MPRPESGGFSVVLRQGALVGLSAGVAVAGCHWVGTDLMDPAVLGFDLAILMTVFAGLGVLATRVPFPRSFGSDGDAVGPVLALALTATVSFAWVASIAGTYPGAFIKMGALACLALGATGFVGNWIRGRRTGADLSLLAVVLGLATPLSILGYQLWQPLGLLLPGSTAALWAWGIPRRSGTPASPRPSHGGLLASIVLAMGGATFFAAGTLGGPGVGPLRSCNADPGPSVILIVMDTVRRDHVSLYGYARPTTPHLDAWAAGGLVFEDAISASSWTLPSHASIFTGLPPRSHGAHGRRAADKRQAVRPLAAQFETLAEVASAAGYDTAAFVANNGYLTRTYGVDQGFDDYWVGVPRRGMRFFPSERLAQEIVDGPLRWPYFPADVVTDNAIRWLDSPCQGRFFLFLNFFDAHTPYRPGAAGRLSPQTGPVPGHETFEPRVDAGNPLPTEVRSALIDGYDRGIARIDEELGRLFEYLETRGQGASTHVVVTSDHGEYFGEHELVFHSRHLHDPAIRVPLIVGGPRIEAGHSSQPVGSVDLFALLLDLLELDHPRRAESVLSGAGGQPQVAEWFASENPRFIKPALGGRFDRDLHVLRSEGLKLFQDSRGRSALFDLSEDPDERVDRTAKDPRMAAMQGQLSRWLAANPESETPDGSTPDLSEEQLERLRALGYLD